jgi:23S rRNA (adenine2030-N6)-methyltransferase
MNYRHAFHAGNHTEVFKHAALILVLEHLLAKPQPFAVLDTMRA